MYKDYIERLKKEWVGKIVSYQGEKHKVVDVDYNGALLIDKPVKYCGSYTSPTMAIMPSMIDK